MQLTVQQATISDVELLVPLFDAYRQFYGQAADIGKARQFLTERFRFGQSAVFLALDEQRRPIGFVQLYPSFSSVSAAMIFILNDLFVVPQARSIGAGSALIDAAVAFASAAGAVRVSLETAVTNTKAQALYERKGWVRGTGYYAYSIEVDPS